MPLNQHQLATNKSKESPRWMMIDSPTALCTSPLSSVRLILHVPVYAYMCLYYIRIPNDVKIFYSIEKFSGNVTRNSIKVSITYTNQ